MSSLDKIPLPPVLSSLVADPSPPALCLGGKKVLIAYAKDLSMEDKLRLKEYGKILDWDSHLINLPFSGLDCDYLLVDVRNKAARIELAKQDLKDFEVVSYVSWVQKAESFIQQIGAKIITSFPKKSINKEDFDSQLFHDKIASPSFLGSVFRLFLQCLQK
jgi:hypothetical protein